MQPERMMMPRIPGSAQRQFNDLRERDPLPPRMMSMMQKYRAGVFLEYSNSSYLSQRRLVTLLVILFLSLFFFFLFLIFSLYKSNRKLVIKSEHDKQLIQLGEAARTLAHEIRNPLGTLKIQRDILQKKLPDGLSGSLDVIDRELKRLNMLVDRVGEFLRNPRGGPVEIELCGYLEQLYSGREDLGIRGCDQKYFIEFDRERLRTVIDNVVNNAVDNGGFAEIILKNENRGVVMIVKDHGDGFTEEALKRAYDPFFTTRDRGTGLGLSVVKRLIDSSGGRVEITNSKEGGACVCLEFNRRTH
jgi:two-component system sensor histidine kinase HydH